MINKSIFLMAAGIFISVMASLSQAQGISMTPAVLRLEGREGQSATHTLSLRNSSNQDLYFEMEAEDVVVREGKRVFLPAGELPDSIAASAVFSPRELTIPGNSTREVKVTLTLPAAVRHRATAMIFRSKQPVSVESQSMMLSLGSLFTFTLSDRISVSGKSLEALLPTATDNLRFQSTFFNDGDEPIVPSGAALILSDKNQLVGKAAFTPERLLPGETRTLQAQYSDDLKTGTYRVVATFDIGGRPLILETALSVQP